MNHANDEKTLQQIASSIFANMKDAGMSPSDMVKVVALITGNVTEDLQGQDSAA